MRAGEKPNKVGKTRIDMYSPFKLTVLHKSIQVSVSVALLFLPVLLSFLVSMTRLDISLFVFVFVLAFCIILCSVTNAKTQEVFIGTAWYVLRIIVLVV
jgi:hypothetical protein